MTAATRPNPMMFRMAKILRKIAPDSYRTLVPFIAVMYLMNG
jgi:hypothetical protein